MQWKKDPKLKYTDLCIYIDDNVEKLRTPGEFPEVENKIYNYLWLLVKALAIKKCMFTNFQDYDPYAFYAANRLFFALRKNLQNQGKVIKGKQIRPIKSCLNYTKALLYPMKIEYQREAFAEIVSEEFVSKKFDAFNYKEHLKSNAKESQGLSSDLLLELKSVFKSCGQIVDTILEKSPFSKGTSDYHRLKISILLNCILILKTKKKLNATINTVVLWKLPRSMSNYVKVILRETCTELKKEIMACYKDLELDDHILDVLISNPEETNSNEDQY